jgi:hypothetical protein
MNTQFIKLGYKVLLVILIFHVTVFSTKIQYFLSPSS